MNAAKSTKSQADKILSIIMLPQGKKKKITVTTEITCTQQLHLEAWIM